MCFHAKSKLTTSRPVGAAAMVAAEMMSEPIIVAREQLEDALRRGRPGPWHGHIILSSFLPQSRPGFAALATFLTTIHHTIALSIFPGEIAIKKMIGTAGLGGNWAANRLPFSNLSVTDPEPQQPMGATDESYGQLATVAEGNP